MARRSSVAAASILTVLLALAAAPASAQQTAGSSFAHDATRDGTPTEVVSGFGGDPAIEAGDPLAARIPNTYETFPVTVPAGETNGTLIARVEWANAAVDFDIYLYRQRADGTLRPGALASSAAGGTTFEELQYRSTISSDPVDPGTYVLVVDNWCSSSSDPESLDPANAPSCAGVNLPGEDAFTGTFSFGAGLPSNPLPAVTLAGPDVGRPGDVLTYTATATDDGRVRNYAFDFDGDGRFETDRFESATAARRFETAGTFNVGVRVTDDRGGQSYASKAVVIAAPASSSAGGGVGGVPRGSVLLSNFSLGRPAFGGRSNASLGIRFRLREAARVTVTLYRGSRRIRRLSSSTRAGNRTYRLTLRPRGLRDGPYTVLIDVRSADGPRQVARLRSRKL